MNTLEALDRRLTSLEGQNAALARQNTWLKRALGIGVALVGGLAITAAAAPTPTSDILQTKRLVIVDDKGETRGFFDAAQGHGRIWIYDENGKVRTYLGPKGLQIDDEGGKSLAHIP